MVFSNTSLKYLLLAQANGHACVDFGRTHPIDGFNWVVLKSTHLLVGFLLKI
jgi:hypothetical protein